MTFAWMAAGVHGIAQESYPSLLIQRPVATVMTGGRVSTKVRKMLDTTGEFRPALRHGKNTMKIRPTSRTTGKRAAKCVCEINQRANRAKDLSGQIQGFIQPTP